MKQLSSRQIKAAMLASGPSWTDAQLIARTEARAKEVREDCYLYRWRDGTIVITQGRDTDHPKLEPLHVARYVAPQKARAS